MNLNLRSFQNQHHTTSKATSDPALRAAVQKSSSLTGRNTTEFTEAQKTNCLFATVGFVSGTNERTSERTNGRTEQSMFEGSPPSRGSDLLSVRTQGPHPGQRCCGIVSLSLTLSHQSDHSPSRYRQFVCDSAFLSRAINKTDPTKEILHFQTSDL